MVMYKNDCLTIIFTMKVVYKSVTRKITEVKQMYNFQSWMYCVKLWVQITLSELLLYHMEVAKS